MKHRGETISPIASSALPKKPRRMGQRSKRRTRAAEVAATAGTGRYPSWLPALPGCFSLSVVLIVRPRETSTTYVSYFEFSSRAAEEHSGSAKPRATYEYRTRGTREPREHAGVPSQSIKRSECGKKGTVCFHGCFHVSTAAP